MLKPRLLICQSIPDENLRQYLTQNNFVVEPARSSNILDKISCADYDIAIIDTVPDNPDRLCLAKEIRAIDNKIGLVFLPTESALDEIVEGLNLGIDEYIIPPYNIYELMARLRALARRIQYNKRVIKNVYQIGRFTFKVREHILIFDNENELAATKLSDKKNRLLQMLCSYMGELVPRNEFLKTLWGDANWYNTRTMDVYIVHLRRALARDPNVIIENIPRQGYRLIVKNSD